MGFNSGFKGLIENSASCGFILYEHTTIHGQQNIKNICAKFTWMRSVHVNLAQIILSVFYIVVSRPCPDGERIVDVVPE